MADLQEKSNSFDQSVLDKATKIVNIPTWGSSSSSTITTTSPITEIQIDTRNQTDLDNPYLPIEIEAEEQENISDDLNILNTIPALAINTIATSHSRDEISCSVEVKKEVASNSIGRAPRHTRFTAKEDQYLREGIKKYGLKSWSLILKDNKFKFHPSRTRDSLRMRSDYVKFKKLLNE